MQRRISRAFIAGLPGVLVMVQLYLLWHFALVAGNRSGAPLQLMPLTTIQGQLRMAFESSVPEARLIGATQLAGNVLLIAPLGVLLGGWTRAHSRTAAFAATSVAVSVEAYQWIASTGRTSDIDDVILNSAGCLLAFAAVRLGLRIRQTRLTAKE
ncbi:MAG: VanZ family protein [Actinomycetales bacterium]|nr:VanZ family protein [Actinomycetales bacterium]